jgi:hypothetical protein
MKQDPKNNVTEIVRIGNGQLTILKERSASGRPVGEQIVPARFTILRGMALLEYNPDNKVTLRQHCKAFGLGYTKDGRRKARNQIRQLRKSATSNGDYIAAMYYDYQKLNSPLRGYVKMNPGRLSNGQSATLLDLIKHLEIQKSRMISEIELAQKFTEAKHSVPTLEE